MMNQKKNKLGLDNINGEVIKEKLVEVFDNVEREASKMAIKAVDFLVSIIG